MHSLTPRPKGANPDEWRLFLCEYLDSRVTARVSDPLAFVALQISAAIEDERERCAKICDDLWQNDTDAKCAGAVEDAAAAIRAGGTGG